MRIHPGLSNLIFFINTAGYDVNLFEQVCFAEFKTKLKHTPTCFNIVIKAMMIIIIVY